MGFHCTANRLRNPSEIRIYPALKAHTPSPFTDAAYDSTILDSLVASRQNLEDTVRSIYGKWVNPGFQVSPAARAEEVNLERCTHLQILDQGSGARWIASTAASEVLLRRLWCLSDLERKVIEEHVPRREAWISVRTIPEHTPLGLQPDRPLNQIMRREYSTRHRYHLATQNNQSSNSDA